MKQSLECELGGGQEKQVWLLWCKHGVKAKSGSWEDSKDWLV